MSKEHDSSEYESENKIPGWSYDSVESLDLETELEDITILHESQLFEPIQRFGQLISSSQEVTNSHSIITIMVLESMQTPFHHRWTHNLPLLPTSQKMLVIDALVFSRIVQHMDPELYQHLRAVGLDLILLYIRWMGTLFEKCLDPQVLVHILIESIENSQSGQMGCFLWIRIAVSLFLTKKSQIMVLSSGIQEHIEINPVCIESDMYSTFSKLLHFSGSLIDHVPYFYQKCFVTSAIFPSLTYPTPGFFSKLNNFSNGNSVGPFFRESSTRWLGFDVDFTLVDYNWPNLVNFILNRVLDGVLRMDYREMLIEPLPMEFAIRGLVLDKSLGNLIILSEKGNVARCFHGSQEMTPPQISVAYPQFLLENFNIQSAETSSRYVILQTGFALPAGPLFAALVDAIDNKFYFDEMNQTQFNEAHKKRREKSERNRSSVPSGFFRVFENKQSEDHSNTFEPLPSRDRSHSLTEEPVFNKITELTRLCTCEKHCQKQNPLFGSIARARYGLVAEEVARVVKHVFSPLCSPNVSEMVHSHPEEFIHSSPKVVQWLKRIRKRGIRLFIITNGSFSHASPLLDYAFGFEKAKSKPNTQNNLRNRFSWMSISGHHSHISAKAEGSKSNIQKSKKKMPKWLRLFDLVICSANKTTFFSQNTSPFRAINPITGECASQPPLTMISPSTLNRQKLFNGGNVCGLNQLFNSVGMDQSEYKTSENQGSNVVFVGDHLFQDCISPIRSIYCESEQIAQSQINECSEENFERLEWKTVAIVGELKRIYGFVERNTSTRISVSRFTFQMKQTPQEISQTPLPATIWTSDGNPTWMAKLLEDNVQFCMPSVSALSQLDIDDFFNFLSNRSKDIVYQFQGQDNFRSGLSVSHDCKNSRSVGVEIIQDPPIKLKTSSTLSELIKRYSKENKKTNSCDGCGLCKSVICFFGDWMNSMESSEEKYGDRRVVLEHNETKERI